MRRYAVPFGSVADPLSAWLVIKTEELLPAEMLSCGFQEVPMDLSDDEVKAKYCVNCIYVIKDGRKTNVN
ncbi:MAG TPA: hypothetical protein VF980_14385 [Thermoanaerobaculia bacterium]